MTGKHFVRAIGWLMLAALILLVPALVGRLPAVNDGLAARQYDSWAGVLRVWVAGGWSPGGGNFVPWLNACATRFEKRNPGVYVQVTRVTEETLAAFSSGEVNPPDAVLFAPGMLESGEGLAVLDEADGMRASLAGVGDWAGEVRALPVAMGGYVWALNRTITQAVPLNWAAEKTPEPIKAQIRYLMQVPADEPYLCWSGALNALCAPQWVDGEGAAIGSDIPGIDLDLPIAPDPTPTPEPAERALVLCKLPTLLPDDFLESDGAYGYFTSGQAAAIPVTQREIRRLQRLSDAGRAPDWEASAGGGAFTDQLLMMGVVDAERADANARQRAARAYLDYLLNEDSQAALASIRALRVTEGERLYAGQMGMDELECAYMNAFTAPNAFDSRFRAQQKAEAERLVRESAVPDGHT